MTSDIVTAEVVEVPKPVRPELWIAIRKNPNATESWLSSHPYEEKDYADGYFGEETLLIKVPGTAPAAATRGADIEWAVSPQRLRALADWLDVEDAKNGRAGNEVQRGLRLLAAQLAALKGA